MEPALSSSTSQKQVKSVMASAKHLGFFGSSSNSKDTEGATIAGRGESVTAACY